MSWAHEKPAIFAGEDELQLKLQFAEMCARDWSNRHMHGYTLFPGEQNYGRAMATQAWLNDPIVQAEVNRLRSVEGGVTGILPHDDEFAKELLDEARQCTDKKDRLGFFKLYAECRGLISKGNVTVNNNNDNRVVKVLRVPERVTEDNRESWKTGFKERQMKLVADARANRPN